MARICITGIWHQGTVLSGCLAEMGHTVSGVCEPGFISGLNSGASPVHEPRLGAILERNLQSGALKFTTSFAEGLKDAEFVFVSTDTPVDANDASDLSSIFAIAEEIGTHIAGNIVLCVTAQVPVGTSQTLAGVIRRVSGRHECDVAYMPEFLRLGSAVDSFQNADRFVIGCDNPATAERVADIVRPLGRPVVFTDVRSAEMSKHASNTFLASSVSFINEVSDLCEAVGADVLEVTRIMKMDRRIGPHAFLSPGLGFAGGTLGRDIRALEAIGQQHSIGTPILEAVRRVNEGRAGLVCRRLQCFLGSLSGKAVGILGMTYKAGTSTLRRAVSLEIVRQLGREGSRVAVFDPLANWDEVEDPPAMRIEVDPYKVAAGADALVLITEWVGIEQVDWRGMRAKMRGDVLLDTRNLLSPETISRAGLRYHGVGRDSRQVLESEVPA